jgi:hypothetical protein
MSHRAKFVCAKNAFRVTAGLVCATPLVASAAFPEYANQNSAATYYHSAICTTTGDVFDTTFANYVQSALYTGATTAKYNEAAFDFNECFSGGMIDELQTQTNGGMGLAYASYTSAAAYNQLSLGWTKPTGTWESSYSYEFLKGVAAGSTMKVSAQNAYNNDIFGPVAGPVVTGGKTYLENPQYTSSGPVGDGIVVGGQDALNATQNNLYLAVLFAGNDLKPSEAGKTNTVIDYNSLVRAYNTLIGLGYNPNNIYICYPGGPGTKAPNGANTPFTIDADASAAGLKAAWNWVGTYDTTTTQVFYWNGMQHGTSAFDLYGYLNKTITNAQQQVYNLSQQFITQLQQTYNDLTALGDTISTQLPTFVIQTLQPLANPFGVTLGTTPLSLIDTTPVDDAGVYEYRYALTGTEDDSLTPTGDDVTLTQGDTGDISQISDIYIDQGESVGDESDAIPEPASAMILVGVFSGLALRRRRR